MLLYVTITSTNLIEQIVVDLSQQKPSISLIMHKVPDHN